MAEEVKEKLDPKKVIEQFARELLEGMQEPSAQISEAINKNFWNIFEAF